MIDSRTDIPVAIYEINEKVKGKSPEKMALNYIAENKVSLGIKSLDNLKHVHTQEVISGMVVRYQQFYEGLRVANNQVVVKVSKDKQVISVTNSYKPINVNLPGMAIDKQSAIKKSTEYLKAPNAEVVKTEKIIALKGPNDYTYGYKIILNLGKPTYEEWRVVVGPESREIISAENLTMYANGQGKVFKPDPLSSANEDYGNPGYSDNNDANSSNLNSQRESVTLKDIQNNNGTYKLEGPYAQIIDSETPYKGLFKQNGSDFSFKRAADAFEAVNCYYHIDKMMRYVNNDLGMSVMPNSYSGGVKYDPHGLNQRDQSHFIPSSDQLAFGEGEVDDGEDADVIIHELGHGQHDWVTGGNASNREGLGEGLGDYFAQSYSRRLRQWNLDHSQYHWVFNWDGHNPFWDGRTTDYGTKYRNCPSCSKNVSNTHESGQVFSTVLMKIYNDIGHEKTDKIVLEGMAMTNSSTTQEEAARKIYQAAKNMNYSDRVLCIIWEHFTWTNYKMSPVGPAPSGSDQDIYMKDTWEDIGNEPNTVSSPLYVSKDIWVRHQQDNKYTHQNPNYNANPNYVYVRVRGRSCKSVTDAKLHLYWSKASTGLKWDKHWINYYQQTHAGNILHGDKINSTAISIPSLEPGEVKVFAIPWNIPDPDDFDKNKHHFCLLARIVSNDDPIHNENSVIWSNVKENNNIVWKNISVVKTKTNKTSVYVRNMATGTGTMNFTINTPNVPRNHDFTDLGELFLTLEEPLFDAWQSAGGNSTNIEVRQGTTVKVTGKQAYLGGIPVPDEEKSYFVDAEFDPNQTYTNEKVVVGLTQGYEKNGGNRKIGGERFVYKELEDDGTNNKKLSGNSKEIGSNTGLVAKFYPNPFNHELKMAINADNRQGVEIALYNVDGTKVLSDDKVVNSGRNIVSLNTSSLANGVYFAKILTSGEAVRVKKVVKLPE